MSPCGNRSSHGWISETEIPTGSSGMSPTSTSSPSPPRMDRSQPDGLLGRGHDLVGPDIKRLALEIALKPATDLRRPRSRNPLARSRGHRRTATARRRQRAARSRKRFPGPSVDDPSGNGCDGRRRRGDRELIGAAGLEIPTGEVEIAGIPVAARTKTPSRGHIEEQTRIGAEAGVVVGGQQVAVGIEQTEAWILQRAHACRLPLEVSCDLSAWCR